MSEQIFHFAFQFLEQETQAAARLLEEHDLDKVSQFLANTPAPTAVKVLRKMLPEYSAPLLLAASMSTAGLWMAEMNSKDLCSILRHVEHQRQQELLGQLSLKKKTSCQVLLSYRNDMVGAFIETDIIVFSADMTIEICVKRLKTRQHREERIILVTDDDQRLVGEVSAPELLRSSKSLSAGSIMRPCPDSISGRSLMRSAIRHPVWNKSDFAPVVNRQRELLGILWYRQLRQFLTSTHANQGAVSSDNPSIEVLHVHGDSMRALVEVFYKGQF